jgi:hypothetical protein
MRLRAARVAVARHDAVAIVNGILCALGGYDGSNGLATVEACDPVSNIWATRALMPTPRELLAMVMVGSILNAIGGDRSDTRLNEVESYEECQPFPASVPQEWASGRRLESLDGRSIVSKAALLR